jgi:hypothetical protein
MDYVEFHFNGPVIRALITPRISLDGGINRLTFPEQGSRDALCHLIGSVVNTIEIIDKEAFIISFDSEKELILPISPALSPSSESIHFTAGPNQPLQVW